MADRNQGGPAAVHEHPTREELPVSEAVPEMSGRPEPVDRRPERAPRPKTGGGIRIYKPSQGYYTRVGTVIGAAILIVAGGVFLSEQIGNMLDPSASYYRPVQYGVSAGFMVVMSALVYWIVGLNHRANDFFIATEGEMKKVNWSTKREVVRSTKVVVVSVLLLAALLFVVDMGFMLIFSSIGVLKASPGLKGLFGSGA
jgi:preprotein translocase subunit SecE